MTNNVIRLDNQRQRRAGYEQQRQKAVEAMRIAAVEFRKLEAFVGKGPGR